MVKDLRIEDFDYALPDERIARYPLAERDSCKLLVRTADGELSEHVFTELPDILPQDSMLVYNNTRVINARLRFRKPGGALIEVFCLEPVEPRDYAVSFAQTESCSWQCFVGNSKRWKQGELTMELTVGGRPVKFAAERLSKEGNSSIVRFSWDNSDISFSEIIAAVGEIPIPPYLNRHTEASDTTDYQTVYSHIDGSVAAPTAGLHFTDRVLERISARGIPRRELTLHVGAGTFQPVKADEIGDHEMHSVGAHPRKPLSCRLPHRRRGVEGRSAAMGAIRGRRVAVYKRRRCNAGHSLLSRLARRKHIYRIDTHNHSSGLPLPGGQRYGDQLPSATLNAAAACVGIYRRRLASHLRFRPRQRLQVSLLR